MRIKRDMKYRHEIVPILVALRDRDNKELTTQQGAVSEYLSSRLTEKEIECMYLYYVSGMKMYEAAKAIGVTVSTFSRNVERGDRKAKEVIDMMLKAGVTL